MSRFTAHRLPALALTALLATACSDATQPTDDPSFRKDGVKMVPFNAPALEGYSYSLGFNVAPCTVSPHRNRTGLDLWGDVSHMGRSAMSASHCNASSGVTIGGIGTITGANGDEVWLTYTVPGSGITILSPNPPSLPLVAQFLVPATIVGGTGRFANATGSATMTCVRTTPVSTAGFPVHVPAYTNHYACSMVGEISSVGSSQ